MGSRRQECARFSECLLEAGERPLSGDDQSFMASHAQQCADCRTEQSSLSAIRFGGTTEALPPLDDLQRRRWARQIAARSLEPTAERREPGRWRPSIRQMAAGLAAAGLLVGLGLGLLHPGSRSAVSTHAHTTVASSPARVVLRSGTVLLDDAPARPRQPIRSGQRVRVANGQAALVLPMGSTLLLGSSSDLLLRRLEPSRIRIVLGRGTLLVSVTRRQHGQTFEVATPSGLISVRGTIFHVESTRRSTVVTVIKGRVRLQETEQRSRIVLAGQTAVMGQARPATQSPDELADNLRLLERVSRGAGTPPEKVGGATGPRGPSPRGPSAPIATSRPRQDHRRVGSWMGQRRPLSPRARRTPTAPSAASLLAKAQLFRRSRDWKGAIRLYRQVVKLAPRSTQAGVALVALGILCLGPCNSATEALRAFSRYLVLSPRGSLAPEAELGRARALRRLGRRTQERDALRAFLKHYPRSLQVAQVRRRLATLGSTKRPMPVRAP